MPVKHTVVFSARGYELDSYNHVNNAVFLNYFEHARWEFFRYLDLYEKLKSTDSLPVVTDVHVRYQREIKLFDQLQIVSFCYVEGPYLIFQQKITNLTSGLSAARSTTKLIFLDQEKTPKNVPVEVISKI